MEGLGWIWEAWTDLTTCRHYTMGGPGPIPWTAIDQYAARHGVTGTDYELLVSAIRAMDGAYMEPRDSKPAPD